MKYIGILLCTVLSLSVNAQDEKILPVAQEMPTLPECGQVSGHIERRKCLDDRIATFLAQNLQYPEAAHTAGVDGSVIVRFVVDEKGKTSEYAVDEDPGYGLGEEAMRVVKKLGKWLPGRNMGEAVKVRMSVPVRFVLDDEPELVEEIVPEVYTIAEKMPRYQGCESSADETEARNCTFQAIAQYMRTGLVYPETAKKQKVTGTVVVKFVIDETGKVTNAVIEEGLGSGCDEEALRLVNSMPQWTPGMQNGRPVKVWQRLPFQFAPTVNE